MTVGGKEGKMENLKALSYDLRKNVVDMIMEGKGGHIGGDMSVMDILVELYFEEEDETEKVKLVTSIRGNSLDGRISIESPLGKAIQGHRVGDRVHVQVNEGYGYEVVIKAIDKSGDDADGIRGF